MRPVLLRLGCLILFAALCYRKVPVHADPPADPAILWSIGQADNSSDEFGLAPAPHPFDTAASSPKDWPQTQSAGENNSRHLRFLLPEPTPAAVELVLDFNFTAVAPESVEIRLNGNSGAARIQPAYAPDLDQRTSYLPTYSRQQLRIPMDGMLLHAGANELAITFQGEAGSVNWDHLALRRAAPAATEGRLEPTLFYRRRNGLLVEIVEAVIRHAAPLRAFELKLEAGATRLRRTVPSPAAFGEERVELELPATPGPYRLTVTAAQETRSFTGQFTPEKQWRLFAGLKIHNDIGFTDYQQNVQALDVRNTDGALDLLARFPFYKFNLEDGWLVDNYFQARTAPRRRQLISMAASRRLGVNAFYLNLLTGLATGEELYRSLYFARRLQAKHAIPALDFACITDAPSHSWFLPTLLAENGVKGFAVGSNQFRAPLLQNSSLNEDSPFWWQGADGTRLLSWYARNYQGLFRITGNNPSPEKMRRTITQFLARYRRANYPVDAVLLYGLYTDNAVVGHGDAAVIEQWNREFAYPTIIPATDADYYNYIKERFGPGLPTYRGDGGAYWEDGAASTAAETALNRETQRLLPAAETASALATLFDSELAYPAVELDDAWKNLLFYDEHSWGSHYAVSQPGRPSVEAQWQYKRGYATRGNWLACDVLLRSLNQLVQHISIDGPTLFVFNFQPDARTDIVETELGEKQELFDAATGAAIPLDLRRAEKGFRVVRFLAESVPGFGYKAYLVKTGAAAPNSPGTVAESRYYRLEIDPRTGAIVHLQDKELGRDLVDSAAPYQLNELLYAEGGAGSRLIEDIADHPPASLTLHRQQLRHLHIEQSPLGIRVRVRAQARNVPEIESEILLYDRLKRVDFVNRLRKTAVTQKEAVYFAFPFALKRPQFAYQVQNALVRPDADQLPGAGREWFATQNLITVRDAATAIAWATPDAPLVTLGDINRGTWPRHFQAERGHIFSYPMNNYWFTNYRAAQGGEFEFRYSLSSASAIAPDALAGFDAATRSPLLVYGHFDKLHVPLDAVKRRMPAPAGRFLELAGSPASIETFKRTEDGRAWLLRLRNPLPEAGRVTLRSPLFPLAEAWLANGVEDPLRPLRVVNGAAVIPLPAHRFTTIRIRLSPPSAR